MTGLVDCRLIAHPMGRGAMVGWWVSTPAGDGVLRKFEIRGSVSGIYDAHVEVGSDLKKFDAEEVVAGKTPITRIRLIDHPMGREAMKGWVVCAIERDPQKRTFAVRRILPAAKAKSGYVAKIESPHGKVMLVGVEKLRSL